MPQERRKGDVNMNLELKKEELNALKCVSLAPAEQSIDLELNLPDYCSDIRRILKCMCFPSVNSVRRESGSVTASGEIVIRLVYVNSDEKLDCFEHKTELSKTAELKEAPENAVLSCECETEYINCRAASRRRISLDGSVSVLFKARCFEKTELITGIESPGAQTLRKEETAVCITADGEKCFDMSETASLPQDAEPIGKIVRSRSYGVLESAKAVSGKLLIKGDFVTEVLYLSDSSGMKLELFCHSMPISQIIEIPNLTEDDDCSVKLSVRALSLQPRADSTGSNRLLEIAAKVCALVTGTTQKSIEPVTDCYSTSCAIKADYAFVGVRKKAYTFDFDDTYKKTAELSGRSAKTVLDAQCLKSSCSVVPNGEKLECRVNILAGVIFEDADSTIQYAEKDCELTIDANLHKKLSKTICEPYVTVEKVEAAPLGGEKVQFSFRLRAKFNVYSAEQKRVCVAACEDENAALPEHSALIICYPKKGEKIWNIAKKYGSTCKAIADENDLSGDEIEEEKMIMIPCGC